MTAKDKFFNSIREAEKTAYILDLQIAARKYPGLLVDLIESNPDLLCIFNDEGEFVLLSPAWETYLGWTRKEMQGRKIIDFIHPEDRAATLEAIAYPLEGREPKPFINRYQKADGGYAWVYWHPTQPSTNKDVGIAYAKKYRNAQGIKAGFLEVEIGC